MSEITKALAATFHEAVEQAAHASIKDPDDWRTFQETQESYDRVADECRKRFDEEFDSRVSSEVLRLAEQGPSHTIKGPDDAPIGETIQQRAQRNVVNAHQADLDGLQVARTNALATVLEAARAKQDGSLEPLQDRAQQAFNEVNDRRKVPDRRAPTRNR